MKEGFDNIQAVEQAAPAFGVGFLNEAFGHLLKGEGSKAVSAATTAIKLGETSPNARAVLAEADIIDNRLDDAGDQLKTAMQAEPNNPVVLAARAKLASAMGDTRGAQRYRSQALIGGAPIAVDGALAPSYTKGCGAVGSANEDHYNVDQRLFQADPTGGAINLKSDAEQVQNRSDAFQSLTTGTGEVASSIGALHFDYIGLGGGRPGTASFEPGVVMDPTSNLNFHQSNVYGNLNLGPFVLHSSFRASSANQTAATAAAQAQGTDAEATGEVRYDLSKWGGKSTAGFAYTHLNRSLTNGLVIDPTEELLPAGKTDLWTGYVLHTRDINPLIQLNIGGLVGRDGAAVIGEPYLDVAIHLGTKNLLHFGVTSLFNTDVGDLMPDQLRAPSVIDNPVDRNQQTTTPYNNSPLLLTQTGQQQTYAATVTTTISPLVKFTSSAYHNELKNVTIQGTDPQTAAQLNPNQLSSGNSTGVSETVSWDTGKTTSVRAKAYVQHTAMNPMQALYNGNQPGVPAPGGLPYAPGFGLDLGFNLHGSDWTSTLVASTLGRRTVATAEPMGDGTFCCSYIQVVNPVTSWNLFLHKQTGPVMLYLQIYNITKVSFYPGDPGRTTVVFGFQL